MGLGTLTSCPHALPLVVVLVYWFVDILSHFIVRCSSTIFGCTSSPGTAQDTERRRRPSRHSHTTDERPLHHYRACGRPSCAPHNTYIHTYTLVSSTRTRPARSCTCRVSPYATSTPRRRPHSAHHTHRMAWIRPRGLFESGERGGARASARVLVVGRSGSVDSELSRASQEGKIMSAPLVHWQFLHRPGLPSFGTTASRLRSLTLYEIDCSRDSPDVACHRSPALLLPVNVY